MALQTFPLPPASPSGRVLSEILPKNWHRYPTVPVPTGGSVPAFVRTVTFSGNAAIVGAAAGNNGETGTPNSTTGASVPYTTQGAKATALGKTIAPDVGVSYHGTRGAIYPDQPYPVKVLGSQTAAAYLPSNFVPPTVIP
jgi:hypothetical protein